MREITGDELKQLQSENKKILVDFKAKWCSPCKTLMPILDKMSNDYSNIEFVAIDVDENTDIAMDFSIRSVPTVLIFDGEKLTSRLQGIQPITSYTGILNSL